MTFKWHRRFMRVVVCTMCVFAILAAAAKIIYSQDPVVVKILIGIIGFISIWVTVSMVRNDL